jgi:hypothetical protein
MWLDLFVSSILCYCLSVLLFSFFFSSSSLSLFSSLLLLFSLSLSLFFLFLFSLSSSLLVLVCSVLFCSLSLFILEADFPFCLFLCSYFYLFQPLISTSSVFLSFFFFLSILFLSLALFGWVLRVWASFFFFSLLFSLSLFLSICLFLFVPDSICSCPVLRNELYFTLGTIVCLLGSPLPTLISISYFYFVLSSVLFLPFVSK